MFTINPFGNADDPVPPVWFMPGATPCTRAIRWWIRNPMHNLMFYWLGVAGKPFTRTSPDNLLPPGGGWMFAVTRYRWLRLPFLSYAGRYIEFYAGWRNSGALGFALRKTHD